MLIRIGYSGSRLGMTVPQMQGIHWYLGGALAGNDWDDPRLEARHGDCIGGDAEFHVIARCLGAYVIIHPPLNSSRRAWCKADEVLPLKGYMERNWDIAAGSGELLAAPSTPVPEPHSGTWATIRDAVHLGRPARVFAPDGTVRPGSDFYRVVA